MDLELTLYVFGAYIVGSIVGAILSESRFEDRVRDILFEMAEEGYLRHRVEDDNIVFLKYDNKETK